MAWTYHDWRSAGAPGSSARLTALRGHIAEVTQAIGSVPTYSMQTRSVDKSSLIDYLKTLNDAEKAESAALDTSAGTRVGWSRGKARFS